jgi:hypothetical protein
MNQTVRKPRTSERNKAPSEPVMTLINELEVLNWYRQAFDSDREIARGWLVEYANRFMDGAGASDLRKVPLLEFRFAMAVLARQACLDFYHEREHQIRFYLTMLARKVRLEAEKPKDDEPVKTVSQKVNEQVERQIADIEDILDKFFNGNYKDGEDTDFFKLLQSWDVKGPQARKILDYYDPLLSELKEAAAGKDSQLKEAYQSRIGLAALKRYVAFVGRIVDAANSWLRSAKAQRKPRKVSKKVRPTDYSKLNYLKVSNEFQVTSVNPATITGSQMFLTFNETYRTLTVYYAKDANGLNVKSTSMVNYDEERSFMIKLRKPLDVLPTLFNGNRKYIENALSVLKVKKAPARSVLNTQTILLRAIKG